MILSQPAAIINSYDAIARYDAAHACSGFHWNEDFTASTDEPAAMASAHTGWFFEMRDLKPEEQLNSTARYLSTPITTPSDRPHCRQNRG